MTDLPRSRILVVEDEYSIRMIVQAFLSRAGYAVELAEDAREALAKLDQEPYDLVLSDIVLPGLSGVELAKVIRQSFPGTRVILMTGEPRAETADEARQAGAVDYLCKPVPRVDLLKAVEKALKGAG